MVNFNGLWFNNYFIVKKLNFQKFDIDPFNIL